MTNLVIMKNQHAVTTSLQIAESFEKRHDHLLRDIGDLEKNIPKIGEMFLEGTVEDSYGRDRRIYFMNRDGFSLLAMGFTGKKALGFKLKYIEAFNQMEQKLKGNQLIGITEKQLNKLVDAKVTAALAKQNKPELQKVSSAWAELRSDISKYVVEKADERRDRYSHGMRSYTTIEQAIYLPIKFALNLSKINEMTDVQAVKARMIFNAIKNNEYQNSTEKPGK